MSKRMILIDGNSLLFRAFYALPPMTTKDGVPTGAIHGFLSMLLKLIERDPQYLAVAFDRKEPTFRHLKYEQYKAGRRETPDDLIRQIGILQDILKEMGICVISLQGYEADDILGTLSLRAEKEGIESLIVTGDRDALQLVSESNHVLLTKKGITETIEYTPSLLMETYGLIPDKMRDLKALMGDNSDNIPGIPGVGEKTALKLLLEYGDINSILESAHSIKGKLGEKIENNKDLARLSYELGTIDRSAPVKQTEEDCRFRMDQMGNVKSTLMKLEMRSILQRFPAIEKNELQDPFAFHEAKLQSEEDFSNVIRIAEEKKCIAIDYAGRFSIAVDDKMFYCISKEADLFSFSFTPEYIWKNLAAVLQDGSVEKIVFDSKALRHILSGFGIELAGPITDLMIEDYLLNSVRPSTDVKALVQTRLQLQDSNAAALIFLADSMKKDIDAAELTSLYTDIELPLSEVLFDMEKNGFSIDLDVLKNLSDNFGRQASELENEIYDLAGETFNILSPKQLGNILFDKLGLPSGKKNKTGYSTDAETLEKISEYHPIVDKILSYRFLAKLKSTFLDAMIDAVSDDSKIHTRFNQCVTATGRISSTEPNLQNIPARTEQGKEIRKAFVASEGNVLIGADYSQIELRLLAHISGDESMIRAFNSGDDIHRRTASEVFGVPFEAVTPELRSAAKAVNFGIVYGISDFGLSKNLNIPVKRAAAYIQQYLDRYSRVKNYMDESVEKGKTNGFVSTLFKRRRYLPELASSNYNMRSFGERVAMNMPIQGTAADIIKVAMVRVYRSLKDKGLKAKLILQIHDELIVDTPIEETETVMGIVQDAMENVLPLSVPLTAEVKAGHSWFDTK